MLRFRQVGILVGLIICAALPIALPARAQGGSVIASDNFNRSNESPFAVTGNWGRVIAGNYDGVSALESNQVRSVSKEGIYYWTGAGTFDPTRQYARARVVDKNGEVGLILLADADQSINIGWGPPGVGDTVYIYWYENGSDRGLLGTGPSTLANGDIIEAVLENGVISAKVNGVTVKSVSNTTTLTNGTPGFITYLDTSLPSLVGIFDDWEAGTPQSYSISGTITEDGNGLSGVLVTASGGFSGNATTDVAGQYTIPGVPSSTVSVVLTPTLLGHTMSPTSRTVSGPLTGDVTGQDFTSTANSGALLTIHATNGTVTKDPDQPSYTFGQVVTLTPAPNAGYTFGGWSGNVPVGHESDNPLLVTMDQDREITANFFGEGIIAADSFNRPDETPFAVGGNWQRAITTGTSNLSGNQVAGASNEAVYYWQGLGSFNGARQFARAQVVDTSGQLGIVLLGGSGKGIVTAWAGGRLIIYWYSVGSHQGELANIAAPLQAGDQIEAVLDQGRIFAKRNGAVVHSVVNTTSLTSGAPGFETYLTGGVLDDWEAGTPPVVSISGTITEDGNGLSGVTVTATGGFAGSTTTAPDGTYAFPSVPSGAATVVITPTLAGHAMSPASRTVPGPVLVNVTGQDFTSTLDTGFELTVNASHGSVTKNPDLASYDPGTQVTLTPLPDGGYTFANWSGDVPVGQTTDNPLVVTMNQHRTITANFVAEGLGASDNFNRADETPVTVGGNWQRVLNIGSANLSNQRIAGASLDAVYFWQGAGAFSTTRQFARSHVIQASGQVGIVLLGASGQGIVTAWGGGRLYIYWYSGGSHQAELANIPATLEDGDEIEAVLDQGRIFARRNGVLVHSVPNSTSLTSGKPGFETYLSGAIFDDWEAGTPPTVSISGTITEDGSPLSGVLVTASGSLSATATTSGSGEYTFTDVPYGVTSIVLTPSLFGHLMAPNSRTVTGPLATSVTGQDFTSTLVSGTVLTVSAAHGTVTKSPDLPTYPYAANVDLTPVPDTGYRFVRWVGDVPAGDETDDPLHLVMDQHRTITAVFYPTDVVARDTFDRPAEIPLTVGGNWQKPFGGGTSNLVLGHVEGVSGDSLYYWQGAGTFDTTRQFARATVLQPGGQVGMVLLGSPGKALVVAWNAGTLYIYWYLGGVNQGPLATFSSTLQSGDVIEALLENGTVYAKIDGTVVASVANTTSLTSGQPGFETFQSGAAFDDWEAGPPPSDCTGLPDGTLCDDGEDACTPTDTCQAGICVGASRSCNDGNVCTVDSCVDGVGCSNVPGNAGAVCRPAGNGCDAAETCDGVSSTCPADQPSGDVGVPCDGPDSDLCAEGVTVCNSGTIVCDDATADNLDVCNGIDDDCDPASADGSEDAGIGAACDGPDSDLCAEGVTVCTAGGISCSDTSGDNLDVCNGIDDDCDPASADGSEDSGLGVACDGPDSDLCAEGVTTCSGGGIVCDDATESTLDVCNGADDDCDPSSADGSEDSGVGVACDGPDTDLCVEGATVCESGGIVCTDTTESSVDLCNGADDDCDPASADGSEDPGVGVACDGPDSDLCVEGTTVCESGGIVCSDATGSTVDLCNGLDDDCDPASADGSEDPGVGAACDGPDTDLCVEGVTVCESGGILCTDATASTVDLCNGADDDCDPSSADGSEDPGIGVACDGPDSDLCTEGVTVCDAGGIVCSDTTGSTVDLCNGLDDDCDPASADGSEDPGVGAACDGPDTDLCVEGVTVCESGGIICTDATASTVDLCNGADDDCDPASADGSEDPGVGVACDGPDADLCVEGTTVCESGGIACSDTTGSTVDLCNGLDDDCDPASADGSEDPSVGVACDGPDSDLCAEGVTVCDGGGIVCSDTTGNNVDVCNGIDDDCDGATDEDFVSAPTSCGIGACASTGVTTCVAGQPGDTCTAGTPAASDASCNGIDDDCDGPTDEDFVSAPTSCGIGACASTGVTTCVAGQPGDTCTAGTPAASDASCNGIDDDCDGPTDEDFVSAPTSCGIGACAATGATTCVAGQPGNTCTPGTPAANDSFCNGIDDDCDGATDEDFIVQPTTCGVGACVRAGVSTCVLGVVGSTCVPGLPGVESCNGIDDDCNGTADENGLALCEDGNSCNGVELCAGATGCQAGTPPVVASSITVPANITGPVLGTVTVPVLANAVLGSTIELTLTYEPLKLQPVSVTKSLLTLGATLTTDLSTSGQVKATLVSATPMSGAGPLVFVTFQILAPFGTTAPIGLIRADVDAGLVSACHGGGDVDVCLTGNGTVTGLVVSGKTSTSLSWERNNFAFHRYDVASGTLLQLRADRSMIAATCLVDSTANPTGIDSRPNPAAGNGYYYLVRIQDECATGSYGNGSNGDQRWPLAACP